MEVASTCKLIELRLSLFSLSEELKKETRKSQEFLIKRHHVFIGETRELQEEEKKYLK